MSENPLPSAEKDAPSRETQYAVRYGDGEIEGEWDAPWEAEHFIQAMRRSIVSEGWDADDYEPMELVSRTVETYRHATPWTRPIPPGGGSDG